LSDHREIRLALKRHNEVLTEGARILDQQNPLRLGVCYFFASIAILG
jgi:hypothetical protein